MFLFVFTARAFLQQKKKILNIVQYHHNFVFYLMEYNKKRRFFAKMFKFVRRMERVC